MSNRTTPLIKKAVAKTALTPDELAILRLTLGLSAKQAKSRLMGILAIAHLKDSNGHFQKAAAKMGVHRNTFSRIVDSGIRKKRAFRGVEKQDRMDRRNMELHAWMYKARRTGDEERPGDEGSERGVPELLRRQGGVEPSPERTR